MKYLLTTSLIAAIFATSCKKDNDNPPPVPAYLSPIEQKLVGKWYLSKVIDTVYYDNKGTPALYDIVVKSGMDSAYFLELSQSRYAAPTQIAHPKKAVYALYGETIDEYYWAHDAASDQMFLLNLPYHVYRITANEFILQYKIPNKVITYYLYR